MGDTVNTPTVKHLHRGMSAFQSRGGRNTFPQILETCITMQKAGKHACRQASKHASMYVHADRLESMHADRLASMHADRIANMHADRTASRYADRLASMQTGK